MDPYTIGLQCPLCGETSPFTINDELDELSLLVGLSPEAVALLASGVPAPVPHRHRTRSRPSPAGASGGLPAAAPRRRHSPRSTRIRPAGPVESGK
jgi:hypothetical protein